MASHRPPRKYIIVLAVVAGLVLLIGGKFKPKRAPEVPVPQAEMLRLEMLTQRKNLEDMTDFFARVAGEVRHALVWVRGLNTSGLVWDETGQVVTAVPVGPVRARIRTDDFPLSIDVVSPSYPVAALQTPEDVNLRTVFRALPSTLQPGSWVVQAALRENGRLAYAPGTFGGVAAISCGDFEVESLRTNLPLTDAALGGGVFDMDGNLLAVVLRCGAQYAAVTPAGVEQILAAARSFEGQLLRRYGFRVESVSDVAKEYFGTSRGVLVTSVLDARPAEVAGLEPGDVIQALDDGEVNEPEDLARLVLPVAYAAFDVWVWRGKKIIRVNMPATEREFRVSPALNGEGIFLTAPPQGYLIGAIIPGSPADAASLKKGDRLLTVGARPLRNVEAARKILGEHLDEPLFVVVRREDRRLGVFLNQ